MIAESPKYPGLWHRDGDVAVDFVGGKAEVSDVEAASLRRLPAEFGVIVPEPQKRTRAPKQSE